MKKILLSLLTIGVVSAGVFGATKAFFTDTETSAGNTFSAGTIDIEVDGQNPWSRTTPYQFADMKPSQVEYANFVIKNVGINPANIWKRIDIATESGGTLTEPECSEGGGTWENGNCTGPYDPKENISSAIRYDLTVWVYDVDPAQNPGAAAKWWQIIYTDEMDKRLNTLNGQNILLGMVPAGWYMKVQQSYHMDPDTGNWAQGDVMTFNITLTAEQLKGTVLMENKNFANEDNPTIVHDDIQGTLTYGVRDSKFNWSFSGRAPKANTEYALLFYYEQWSTPSGTGWPRDVYVLGKGITNSNGDLTLSGFEDLNKNILNMKVWLVTTSSLTSGNLGNNQMNRWSGNDYLFELGMMDYYDADL